MRGGGSNKPLGLFFVGGEFNGLFTVIHFFAASLLKIHYEEYKKGEYVFKPKRL